MIRNYKLIFKTIEINEAITDGMPCNQIKNYGCFSKLKDKGKCLSFANNL